MAGMMDSIMSLVTLAIFVVLAFLVWRAVNRSEADKFQGEAEGLWAKIKAMFGK